MDLGLSGKVALVTGASRGMGLGIARALSAEGARVAVSSRSRERIERAAREIGAQPFVHDAADLDGIADLVAGVERALGPIDVLVANAGGPPAGADPLGFEREDWERAHRTLVLFPLALVARVLPGMRERRWGRVLSISSSAVREPIANLMLSNSHRPGLVAAFKTLARGHAAENVTFNTILPGRIATERMVEMAGSLEAAEAAAAETIPAARLGRVEEIAAVAAFLCSERASYVTGTTITVDGALTHSI